MSAAHRFRSCACCGTTLGETDRVTVEPLVQLDSPVMYVPVLEGHSTFSTHPTWVQKGGQYVRNPDLV